MKIILNMQPSENHHREYRLLALAIVFFLVGLFFFLRDNAPVVPASPSLPSQSKPAVSVQPAQPAQVFGLFAHYPPPSQFRTFIYNSAGLNGGSSITVSAVCHDTYDTVLIFPASLDYRVNLASAVYNVASPCEMGKTFNVVIDLAMLGHAPSGTYYYFIADQGASGSWYNPR